MSDLQLFLGDCLEELKKLEDNSVDSVVTDPPYGLGKEPNPVEIMKTWVENEEHFLSGKGFMGKEWDKFVPQPRIWKEVLRVLKPGGHVLSFFGTRTYDWGVMAMRFAGFEIRDQLAWLCSQGFPKSLNINKAMIQRQITDFEKWDGWGSSLKPAIEPIILARKPLSEKSIVDNVLKWGTGGINIDGCRIEGSSGRFPANVIHDGSEQVMGEFLKYGITKSGAVKKSKSPYQGVSNTGFLRGETNTNNQHGDSGSVARFFYCAKASKKDRTCNGQVENKHPTVKPLELMKYLCRLITPPKGVVLDPFMGSGSTGVSALIEGFKFIGVELEKASFDTACARINTVSREAVSQIENFNYKQLTLWDVINE